ncbi:MAG: anthranilate synthase component I [Clostridiales bacterium]|nr:anthranilate synthase component I [Clostridiales bacterium]
MLYPEINQVKELLKEYKTVPVFHEILIDSYTPVEMFNALHNAYENCFILESVDNADRWGRYSFVGINPKEEIVLKNGVAMVTKNGVAKEIQVSDPIEFFSKIVEAHKSPKFPNRPKLTGGLMGYFGYDMVRYFEKTLTNIPNDDLNMPDANLFLFDEIVAYDHLSNKAVIILNINSENDCDEQFSNCAKRKDEIISVFKNYVREPRKAVENKEIEVKCNMTKEKFIENVETAKEYIKNGDVFQVVLSQRFEIDNPPDSFDAYRALRSTNPSPYLFYFEHKDYTMAGASPEMLVSVLGDKVITKPIAGTIKRGITDEEDYKNEKALLNDPKERAEHTMLVDLGRNDIGKVSKFGSVKVTDFMFVERYSKVMHLVSNVEGTLSSEKKPLDALMAVLPAGTLSGAPKVRAMEIIDELEPTKRGLYGGTVGYLGFDGNLDTCIAIRTVLFKNNKAYVQAGGGIVLDSDAESEYQESCNKAAAVINAVRDAVNI